MPTKERLRLARLEHDPSRYRFSRPRGGRRHRSRHIVEGQGEQRLPVAAAGSLYDPPRRAVRCRFLSVVRSSCGDRPGGGADRARHAGRCCKAGHTMLLDPRFTIGRDTARQPAGGPPVLLCGWSGAAQPRGASLFPAERPRA
jgi:hypothetical protein